MLAFSVNRQAPSEQKEDRALERLLGLVKALCHDGSDRAAPVAGEQEARLALEPLGDQAERAEPEIPLASLDLPQVRGRELRPLRELLHAEPTEQPEDVDRLADLLGERVAHEREPSRQSSPEPPRRQAASREERAASREARRSLAGAPNAPCRRRYRYPSACSANSTGVALAAGDQLVVGAFLDDAAALEHDDAVGHAHGREAVRDDDGRPPLGERPEPLEDRVLGLGVERRGGLVEHEDVGLLAHERARERHLLPLPAATARRRP